MRLTASIILMIAIALGGQCGAAARADGGSNLAVHLDGDDNNIRTGIGILEPEWTLEAWVKGDDCRWDSLEVIIGGGEYSDISWVDDKPLVLLDGHLHSPLARITAPEPLDDRWHHVALSCDGKATAMYLDGRMVADADTAFAIIPGSIGVYDVTDVFGGDIDEVRVWRAALDGKTLRRWMNTPVDASHPQFGALWGYYPFDDFSDDTAVNWVGKGHQAYHVRSGRSDYYGDRPLAFAVPADNSAFRSYDGRQRLFNAVVVQNEWDADQGGRDKQALKLRVAVQGSKKPMRLTELNLDFSATTDLADIEAVHLYSTGPDARTKRRTDLLGKGVAPERSLSLRPEGEAAILRPGINYFLVTFDVAPGATPGNRLHASVPVVRIDGRKVVPEAAPDEVMMEVSATSRRNPDVLKVLQWNIWHGGVHMGADGRNRVIELVRSTDADIVMLQEAYGIQQMMADSLGYHMQSHSLKDNLAIFSRYPVDSVSWRLPFMSNPAKVTLPSGRRIMLVDTWLRYAYRPEYTCLAMERGLDPSVWVAEDSILALEDIRDIRTLDIEPNLELGMPVILTGDFNSCSHLDWTERARTLHNGYGYVPFPVSRYMLENGFSDSFREKNPDEVSYQGGTYAAIFGQSQNSRIDFIYYRGGLKVLSSKIIRSSHDIDYVWPSDHAAVLTVFEVEK